jgi:2-keto-4-pentenoate hydratase/2-oxohepta-3-ene-1,7-dioic acid hydratase in catechol pathway
LPWEKAKAFDGSAVIGNFVSKTKYIDINNINFSLKRNNEVVQSGNTSLMLWKIDTLIEYISKYFTLKIGDVIFTGTPSGVGKVFSDDVLSGFVEEEELFSIKVK